MDRAVLRLNVLLEMTSAWGRCASYEELLGELARIKWVLEFDRGAILLDATPHRDARAFVVTAEAAREVPVAELGKEEVAALSGARQVPPPSGGLHALRYPLDSGSTPIGAICFLARAPYQYGDLRFAQFIVEALAGVLDRLAARENERRAGVSEERYRSLVSVLTDVPWRTDPDGAFVEPQPAWSAFTGQTWEALRRFGWVEALHPDDREEVQAVWARACATATRYESRGRLWHQASGEYRHFVARATPLLHPDGTVREWVGTCTDVHERWKAEEALRESERRLKEADRRKDEFIATLGHELRNPLAPIRTGLEMLRVAGNSPASVERVRGVMERQVAHMVRLIDDLLDVSRITSGRIVLQRQPARLAELVQGAVDANRAIIDAGGLRLTVDLPDRPCVLDVDPTRFVQILSNLLHNAAKFTPAGGDIRISARVIEDNDASPEVELRVADTGIGIPAAALPGIFELFAQGPAAGRAEGGLGIGLGLTRQLVELHGGRIEARSAGEHQGSEFIIRLPAAQAAGEAAVEQPAGDVRVARRVLVVDDNEDAAEMLALLVHELGGEACVAHDGETALQRARDFRPEVIVLDIGMPGIDGYETCRRIRLAFPSDPPVVVALTGWGQEQDRQRAMEAGFDAHLTKPADPDALARVWTLRSPGAMNPPNGSA